VGNREGVPPPKYIVSIVRFGSSKKLCCSSISLQIAFTMGSNNLVEALK
jgi:hypothetical protein